MGIDIRFPNINAPTTEGQMAQMQSYMHQLVQQLNWALNTIGEAQSGNTSNIVMDKPSEEISPKEAEDTFNSIKALIIKSADIVRAYEETIKTNFNGEYFADSDFGSYLEQTSRTIEENSKGVTEMYTNVQTITDKVSGLEEEVRITNAYIRKGLLDENNAIYGIEVGETTEDGAYVAYAQFTSDKLTFFDANKNPVAYIGAGEADKSDTNNLYVLGTARFNGAVHFGGYKADTSDGIAFTWVG